MPDSPTFEVKLNGSLPFGSLPSLNTNVWRPTSPLLPSDGSLSSLSIGLPSASSPNLPPISTSNSNISLLPGSVQSMTQSMLAVVALRSALQHAILPEPAMLRSRASSCQAPIRRQTTPHEGTGPNRIPCAPKEETALDLSVKPTVGSSSDPVNAPHLEPQLVGINMVILPDSQHGSRTSSPKSSIQLNSQSPSLQQPDSTLTSTQVPVITRRRRKTAMRRPVKLVQASEDVEVMPNSVKRSLSVDTTMSNCITDSVKYPTSPTVLNTSVTTTTTTSNSDDNHSQTMPPIDTSSFYETCIETRPRRSRSATDEDRSMLSDNAEHRAERTSSVGDARKQSFRNGRTGAVHYNPRMRRFPEMTPTEVKNEAYWEKRVRNNEAARRSRRARKTKEATLREYAEKLEKSNSQLMEEVALLKREVFRLKTLRSDRDKPD